MTSDNDYMNSNLSIGPGSNLPRGVAFIHRVHSAPAPCEKSGARRPRFLLQHLAKKAACTRLGPA